MVVNVTKLKSHPDKLLFKHVDGVISNVKKLTNSKFAELAAIFHDLGKINPNFQDKLCSEKKPKGYANHAYFSAFAFFCAYRYHPKNFEQLKDWLKQDKLTEKELIALTVIIAKHHGHLLDFVPESKEFETVRILNELEIKSNLFTFLLEKNEELPSVEFARNYFPNIGDFKSLLTNSDVQNHFLKKFIFNAPLSERSFEFFLDTQFAFACLIHADKADAANFSSLDSEEKDIINANKRNVEAFTNIYYEKLKAYLKDLKQDSSLNKLRTRIREEAVTNIQQGLFKEKRVFELTSPTGSGKTLMMLALANEILKHRKQQNQEPVRIIYALPFLSITEQVEAEVLKIFKGYEEYIQRIDSKSQNKRFDDIQEALDNNPDDSIIHELGMLTFQENTFGYPFVITTFVRFFETILSNHNATLLKLPNFSKSVFLLDEIQSLPPRLYTFFVAYLTKFCEKFDSYAIISTATQPNFNLPEKGSNVAAIAKFFSDYENPYKLLEHEKYFSDEIFNRYQINFDKEPIDLEALHRKIVTEQQSVLIILNTIDDSKDLYDLLCKDFDKSELVLLNTHFTPNDRNYKIDYLKLRLNHGKKVIAISTQLIEAGVDIDFPILYRDFATVSSIIQSAGRCNRNGRLQGLGKVNLFRLRNREKLRAELIYGRGKDKDILRFTKDSWRNNLYQEKELLNVQKTFFDRILNDLHFAKHSQKKFNLEFDFIKDISDCMYSKIGKFQLIDEQEYGEEIRYYIPENEEDKSFEDLLELEQSLLAVLDRKGKKNYKEILPLQQNMKKLLKKMSGQIVQVRIRKNDSKPNCANDRDFHGLFKLSLDSYTLEKGVAIKGEDNFL